VGACVMPCGLDVGDHRLFIVDIRTDSIVGVKPPRVIRAAARRLNTKIPRVMEKYVDLLEKELLSHRVPQRIRAAAQSSIHPAVVKERTDVIDEENGQYMRSCEKRCSRIKSGRIPFSDKSAVWIRRRQVYHSLIQFHRGKIRNRANLKRAARRCGINRALQLSVKSIKKRLKECEKQCEYFTRHGHRYRGNSWRRGALLLELRRMKKQRRRFWLSLSARNNGPFGGE
jgi:hypothetical protein